MLNRRTEVIVFLNLISVMIASGVAELRIFTRVKINSVFEIML